MKDLSSEPLSGLGKIPRIILGGWNGIADRDLDRRREFGVDELRKDNIRQELEPKLPVKQKEIFLSTFSREADVLAPAQQIQLTF